MERDILLKELETLRTRLRRQQSETDEPQIEKVNNVVVMEAWPSEDDNDMDQRDRNQVVLTRPKKDSSKMEKMNELEVPSPGRVTMLEWNQNEKDQKNSRA